MDLREFLDRQVLYITPDITLDDADLQFEFVRASGPGGQNVNKVASAVQLRYDVVNSSALSPAVKARLSRLAGKRMTNDGVLIIEARRFRTQEQNRQDALERLIALIQQALEKPKHRRKTKPSKAAKERRLSDKRHRSERKRRRGQVRDE